MYRHLLGCSLLIWTMSASGSSLLPMGPSAAEMALLPEYCKVRATDNYQSPEFQSWMQRIGPQFIDLHHYCAGLNYINRYQYRVSDKNRGYYLGRAVPEIDYVAKNMRPDFPLAGEIYFNRGIALQLMRKDAQAIADFFRAIELDPKQVRAYLAIADAYLKVKNKSKALEIVTNGLRIAPESKALQRRYLELGGKKPFPVADAPPLIKKETEVGDPITPAPDVVVESSSAEGAASKPIHSSDQGSADAQSSENSSGEGDAKSSNEGQTPEIGSPTNPYCRFCP